MNSCGCSLQLGHKYPKDGTSPHAVIDVALYEERQLTFADKDTYPLIIRMEVITDKGKADAHTLEVPMLCVHTTCAVSISSRALLV